MRTVALMICAGILSAALCQQDSSKEMAAPALPFYDWGVCPYETCAYKQWTAHRAVTVYDTWKAERRPIAQLAEGDRVTGIGGAVVTLQPGVIRMDRDLPEQNLRRGDTPHEAGSIHFPERNYHSVRIGHHQRDSSTLHRQSEPR